MKLGATYGKLLSGERIVREFLTVGIEDFEHIREKVYLRVGDRVLDVTGNQWLLGLDPRVIGIWMPEKTTAALLTPEKDYRLYFRDSGPVNGHSPDHHALGLLRLDYVQPLEEEDGTLFLFRVQASSVHHIAGIRTRLLYEKFYKKPGVDFERLKAVAAAYTYPRRVRIISFQFDNTANYIFPMDLLADIRPVKRYLFGMRHSNQVLKQIQEVKKIVVAEAPAEYKKVIYQLGRNHSAAPPSLEELPFGIVHTRQFGFCLPEWVESYKEVTIGKTTDLGSHLLLSGKWTEEVVLKPATPRLHHIHFLHYLYLKGRGAGYPVIL
jgi:hypothetical protein